MYVMDENSGLLILKYTGRRAEELPDEGLVEGDATHQAGRVGAPVPCGDGIGVDLVQSATVTT